MRKESSVHVGGNPRCVFIILAITVIVLAFALGNLGNANLAGRVEELESRVQAIEEGK